jgi:hypothetical protein
MAQPWMFMMMMMMMKSVTSSNPDKVKRLLQNLKTGFEARQTSYSKVTVVPFGGRVAAGEEEV